jgi:hypothetical protein
VAWCSRDLVIVNVNNGDGFVGLEGIGAFIEHIGGVVANGGLCVHMLISHHGVDEGSLLDSILRTAATNIISMPAIVEVGPFDYTTMLRLYNLLLTMHMFMLPLFTLYMSSISTIIRSYVHHGTLAFLPRRMTASLIFALNFKAHILYARAKTRWYVSC